MRRLILKTILGTLAVLSVLTSCGSDEVGTTTPPADDAVATTTPAAPVTTPALDPIPDTTRATTAATSPPRTQASAYFANCADARAAGAAPLRRGDPGYRDALDRDDDGIACE